MSQATDLQLLIRSRYPLILVETTEEERLRGLLARVAAGMGLPLFAWSRTSGLIRSDLDKGAYGTEDPGTLLAHLLAADQDGVFLLADYAPYLSDPILARKFRETLGAFEGDRRVLVLSGASIEIPDEIRSRGAPYKLQLPDTRQLRAEVERVVEEIRRQPPERGTATPAAAPARAREIVHLSADELEALVRNLRGLTLEEARHALYRAILEDGVLDAADLSRVLTAKQEAVGRDGLLEFYPPQEDLESVGGAQALKAWLHQRRGALSDRAREFGLEPPRGILLLGVQGCGKSLLARAVAADWHLALLRLDPGTLYDKFVGESERNLRKALEAAGAMAPAVLWIDEIEKGFGVGTGAEDGGLARRLLGTFLTWLQEAERAVFVVATANDISRLPPELLRKGRFDEIFFVDLPKAAERREILSFHLARRERDPATFDLDALAAAGEGFSGAELEAAVVAGLYTAFSAGGELSTETLLAEIHRATPLSVTMAERVAALREWARGRATPAG